MIAVRPSPYLLIGCVVATILLYLSLRSHGSGASTSTYWGFSGKPSPKIGNFRSAAARKVTDTTSELGRASNSTLGFQKVLVLGLQERSDKKDAIVLAASLTGFDVEFFDGVKGTDEMERVRPPGLILKGGVLGSWRTHLNAIRSFHPRRRCGLGRPLTSQLPEFAKGVRSRSVISPSATQHSPYGDDWDVLWPGHCGEVLPKDNANLYTISNDMTVAPKAHQPWLKALKDLPENTRIIHKAGAPTCTFGYAVSIRGAQKILMALAIKAGANLAFDNGLAFLCRDGMMDMKCYSVEPQLFQHHRPAGKVSGDSDINANGGASEAVREKGVTDFVVWSARLNMEQMIEGKEEYVTQWR